MPGLGRTGAVLSLPTDAHPVPLPTVQRADVAGGATGGAGLLVINGKGIGRGVVVEDPAAGGPGHHSCVGVAVQGGLQAAVGTRSWAERDEDRQSKHIDRGPLGVHCVNTIESM